MGLSFLQMSNQENISISMRTPLASADDEALVAAARRDARAFGALYEKYVTRIYRYAFVRLRNEPAAQDATSQIFLKALQALPQFRGGMFAAWLFRIARNVVTDAVRRAPPQTGLDTVDFHSDAGESPEEYALRASERDAFYRALNELPEAQRSVLEFTLAGFKGEEIARMLGKTHASVKMLRWRGMESIKARVAELGYLSEVES